MTTTKLLAPEDAADLVRPSDSIAVPLGPGVPGTFLHSLGARNDFEELEIFGALLPDLYEVFIKPGVRYRSGFYGPAERYLLSTDANIEFVPSDFRGFISVLRALAPRIVATMACPPDADGWMSLSLHAGASVAELERAAKDPARICLVETSPHFPRTSGLDQHRHALHVDDVDAIIDGAAVPVVLDDGPSTTVEEAIAALAATFIPDGATLQTSIGAIPNTIASFLANGSGSGYGVHSEMFTTGLMRLHQAGKITNGRKGLFDGVSVTTFAAGTEGLYKWLDGNNDVRFLPVDVVNAPELIGANHDMITINGAMSIDLSGQAVADTIGGRQFSGIGGHEDFIAGAGFDLSDRSLICLPSTATVKGQVVSRISAKLETGSVVTTPRHQLDVVITEYGVAELRGRTVRERAKALAKISHPDFREGLEAAAEVWR